MKYTWINGELLEDSKACLHVSDLSIQRGYGVFDFFSVTRPRPLQLKGEATSPVEETNLARPPFLLSSYLDRFFNSAAGLNLEVPYSKAELTDIILQFIQKNQLKNHGIKMILTGGYSDDGFTPVTSNLIIRAHELKTPPKDKFQSGFKVMTHEFQRSTPEYKSLDYRHAISMLPTLKEKGLDDLLYHAHGVITELPRSNFFMVDQQNKLVTPANSILKGITRRAVLHLARKYYTVEERDIFTEELLIAKEAFLTSTTKFIMPITEIDGRKLGDGEPGPVTRQLSQLLLQLPQDFEF